jgi:hypothetical protein
VASQVVSERELADTYGPDDGWETVSQYREAIQVREQNPDMARAEIARRVDRPPSAVRGWLVEGKTPRVITGIQTAQERGWLTVDTNSEQFRALNQLVAWIFSGGGIGTDRFIPHFSVDDPLMLSALSQLLRWLQIGYRCREPDDPERHLEVTPTDGGAVLGRILSVLGAPRGIKAQLDDLALPDYLPTADRQLRRDFARIYLLNRGRQIGTEGTNGTYIQSVPSSAYAQQIQDLFESVTAGTATVGHQNRIWVSSTAVRDLAGDVPLRSALATAAVHGSLTPPTDRAVASTFRRSESPGGYRYHQLYQTFCDRDESRATMASKLGVPKTTIQSWRRGSKPYATNALERATERGWLTPPSDSATALSLTALLAWLLVRGSLRETYYPVFGAETAEQQDRFKSIAKTLDLEYNTVRPNDPNWPTELRPANDGTVLGRTLYSLGAPRQTEAQQIALIPPYVRHYRAHAKRFADICCLHHGIETEENVLTISIPPSLGEQFPTALMTLLSEQLTWEVATQTDRELVVSDFG